MYIDILEHKGTPHEGMTPHSGRYAYGSGSNPYQHCTKFYTRYLQLKNEGKSKEEIRKIMGMTRTEFDAHVSYGKESKMKKDWYAVRNMKEQHPKMTNVAIAKKLGITEGTVRRYLKEDEILKKDSLLNTCDILEKVVNEKGIVDVSRGTEKSAGLNQISADRLNKAIVILQDEKGYLSTTIDVRQVQDFRKVTHTKVLAKPEFDEQYIRQNQEKIRPFENYMTNDNGDTWYKMQYPSSVDRKRILVRYAEEGGSAKDGTIEMRRGVADLDIGGKQYAQVRIAVDDKEYMKGMAYYSDNIPDGYDIVYNSNKPKGSPDSKVFKPFETNSDGTVDKDNPFGAVLHNEVGQRNYVDPETGEEKLSPVNIVKPQGEWYGYRKDLASQFLSKQDQSLIKQQLNIAYEDRQNMYEDILDVKNPAVKEKLLVDFGDECDKSAYELRGAALPRQATKVLLPVESLKNNEIYAPQFEDGEEVALVRYPTGGLFEVPKLIVNNRNKEGKSTVTPSAEDAVGINATVAAQLSGADFDGDTVLVLPTKNQKIINKPPFQELIEFDTKAAYPAKQDKDGNYTCKLMTTDRERNLEMGICSNLITDMTLFSATDDELVRAVKYSMVVIDAKKHKLDWRQAKEDFGIAELHKKYQGKASGGASTIISRAKGEVHVEDFEDYRIDPKTGKRIKRYTGKTRWDKKEQEYVPITKEVHRMETVDDAMELVSDVKHPKEIIYANYANSLKALGNESRKMSISTSKQIETDREAAKEYAKEVESIKRKLDEQKAYAPREREAQRQASYVVRTKIQEKGGMDAIDKEDLKKIKTQALAAQRARLDSKRPNIELTKREWEAVEKNACNKTLVQELMKNLDADYLKSLAMPKREGKLPATKVSRIKTLIKRGYTLEEIANMLNVSVDTVVKYK